MPPTRTDPSSGHAAPTALEHALEEAAEEFYPQDLGEFDSEERLPRRGSADSSHTSEEHVYAGMAL